MKTSNQLFDRPLFRDWLIWVLLILWLPSFWRTTDRYYGGQVPLGSIGGMLAWVIDVGFVGLVTLLLLTPVAIVRRRLRRRRAGS